VPRSESGTHTASGLTSAEAAELRTLRSRAYGPRADITADPVALARLRELESAAARTAAEPGLGAREPGRGTPEPPPDAAVPVPAAAPAQPVASPVGVAPRMRGRGPGIAWALSIVITAVLAASVTWWVTRTVEADPMQVAVLGLHPDQRVPTVFGVDPGARRFDDFAGLTIVALQGRGWLGSAPQDQCLLILDAGRVERRTNSYTGDMYGGCGAGGFAATVQLRVAEGQPPELLERFGAGTGLQFVLHGDEVVVLSDGGDAGG